MAPPHWEQFNVQVPGIDRVHASVLIASKKEKKTTDDTDKSERGYCAFLSV